MALGAIVLLAIVYQVRRDFHGASWEIAYWSRSGRASVAPPALARFMETVRQASAGRAVVVVFGEGGTYRAAMIQRVLYPQPVAAVDATVPTRQTSGEIERVIARFQPACVVVCGWDGAGFRGEVIDEVPADETGKAAGLIRLAR